MNFEELDTLTTMLATDREETALESAARIFRIIDGKEAYVPTPIFLSPVESMAYGSTDYYPEYHHRQQY